MKIIEFVILRVSFDPMLKLNLKELYIIEGKSFYNGIVFHGRINHNEFPILRVIFDPMLKLILKELYIFQRKTFYYGIVL